MARRIASPGPGASCQEWANYYRRVRARYYRRARKHDRHVQWMRENGLPSKWIAQWEDWVQQERKFARQYSETIRNLERRGKEVRT